MQVPSGVDSFCTANALGAALSGAALDNVNSSVASGIAGGRTNLIFQFLGSAGTPADLSGGTGPFVLASLGGNPEGVDAGAAFGNGLDWWYSVSPATVDGSRNALSHMTGSYTTGATGNSFTAGPGSLTIPGLYGGAVWDLWNVHVTAAVGATVAPTSSAGGPPGHLAAEHIKPGLTTFGTVASTQQPGELCGNVTAQSLANTPLPSIPLLPTICGVAANGSLLDILVRGCGIGGIAIVATQPDQVDATVTFPAGTVGPYVLSASAGSAIDTCKDKTGTSVSLATCLQGLGYSGAIQFAMDRVIVK
jgi:hypothetical protein